MRWVLSAGAAVLGLAGLTPEGGAAPAADVLVLTTRWDEQGRARAGVEGPEADRRKAFCPASTFKVLLAWAALEEGWAGPETLLETRDAHVPGSPRRITLHQAMFHSSNDYFLQLFAGERAAALDGWLVRSGLVEKPPAGWRDDPRQRITGGGTLRVTPEANHALMVKVARGELARSPDVQRALEAVCRWPSGGSGLEVFGKTGVYGGSVWFNGFARRPDGSGLVVCTVRLPGSVPRRTEAVRTFYRTIGLEWNPDWQTWLEPAAR